jgi:amino acid transporter
LFVGLLLGRVGLHAPAVAIAAVLAIFAWQAAYRGVQVSAIVMLVLEAVSVSIICLVVVLVLHAHGPSLDYNQLHLRGAFPGGIGNVGLAIAFAVFSYVGFESATAFGAEAKRPLVTIPRAVIGSVLFASAFFVIATYAEIVGLSHAAKPLDRQTFPLGTLIDVYGTPELAVPITVGALFSAFSVCLACITTAGRIAYAMANANLLPARFAQIEPRHGTPNVAVTVVTAATLAVAAIALAFGVAPIDVFNNCGTLSSFGFILVYMLIAIAALVYTKRLGAMRAVDMAVSLLALVFLIVPAITLFFPVPAPPQRWFGYYFLAFVAAGWVWFRLRLRKASG